MVSTQKQRNVKTRGSESWYKAICSTTGCPAVGEVKKVGGWTPCNYRTFHNQNQSRQFVHWQEMQRPTNKILDNLRRKIFHSQCCAIPTILFVARLGQRSHGAHRSSAFRIFNKSSFFQKSKVVKCSKDQVFSSSELACKNCYALLIERYFWCFLQLLVKEKRWCEVCVGVDVEWFELSTACSCC